MDTCCLTTTMLFISYTRFEIILMQKRSKKQHLHEMIHRQRNISWKIGTRLTLGSASRAILSKSLAIFIHGHRKNDHKLNFQVVLLSVFSRMWNISHDLANTNVSWKSFPRGACKQQCAYSEVLLTTLKVGSYHRVFTLIHWRFSQIFLSKF